MDTEYEEAKGEVVGRILWQQKPREKATNRKRSFYRRKYRVEL